MSTTTRALVWAFAWIVSASGGAARAEGRQLYELKCLYCHSGDLVEQRRLRPAQWRKLVERMRSSAPLLISARDVDLIVRFLVRDLKLVPEIDAVAAKHSSRKSPPSGPAPAPTSVTIPSSSSANPSPPPEPEPAPWVGAPVDSSSGVEELPPAPSPPSPEELALEQEGPRLLQEKCSKCHTVYRVFTKIDSLGAAEATIERMRKKTGSGISPDDAEILRRFIASRMSP